MKNPFGSYTPTLNINSGKSLVPESQVGLKQTKRPSLEGSFRGIYGTSTDRAAWYIICTINT